MSISKRQEQIIDLIHENGFLSVSKIAELTYTSESSIRRDLKKLQNQSLIRRTHGGASIYSEDSQPIPLASRMTRNITAKKKIAKKASVLLKDGMSIMLDGSSTAGFLVPYIAKHNDVTLFTNNMNTAISAINYGIDTVCVGGRAVNNSAVLSGVETYKTISEIHVDILFFSSQDLSYNGIISDPIPEENYIRQIMLKNASTRVFLCDTEKLGGHSVYTLANIKDIDVAVFDEEPQGLTARCEVIL